MSAFSHLYDVFMYPQEIFGLWKLRLKTVGQAEGQVLEVGVGSGLNFPHYKKAAKVIGIDPDTVLLGKARRRAREASFPVHLEEGNAEDLPFQDESFDTVVATLVYCMVPDALRGLRELRRVVRPGGTIRLLEHVRSPSPGIARVQDLIEPVWVRVSGGCHANRDTVRLIKEAGIVITNERRYSRGAVVAIQGKAAP